MWRTRSPTVNTCAVGDGPGGGGGSLDFDGALRERDCSARMSAGVTSGAASKSEAEVGVAERSLGLRVWVRRRSARLGMSSGIVETILVALLGPRESKGARKRRIPQGMTERKATTLASPH